MKRIRGEFLLDMGNEEQKAPIRYVVVSPVRNEGQYLETTIQSMVAQTVRPARWIIVNDGSTDTTAEILERWAARHSWIVPVHSPDHQHDILENKWNRGKRAYEAKEINAFHRGFNLVADGDWDYVVKLDGDLGFESDYFERCLMEFEANSKLGIGGGVICHKVNGELQIEPTPKFHVRGATKIYRRACWNQIGGVTNGAGWDTIDEVKANMLGWNTQTFPDLKVLHFRFTGAANGGWQNAVKTGTWSYVSGYHPLYMLARCVKGLFEKPFVAGALGMFYGFFLGYVRHVPQTDRAVVRYVRKQQLRRLVFLPTIWH